MRVSIKTILMSAIVLFQFVGIGSAQADVVLRCDNCSSSGYAATARASAGTGYVYVIDVPQAKLTLWDVTYDREMGSYWADPKSVSAEVTENFLYTLDEKIEAKSSGQSVIILNIRDGQPPGPGFSGDPLRSYTGSNAYHIVNSGTTRNNLATAIANSLAAATSQSVRLNDLGITLQSVLLSLTSPVTTQISFKIVVTWKDGSKTTFEIDASSANQAKYVQGESKDRNGNPIPDPSVHSSDGGGKYQGVWTFDTTQSVEDWVNAAIMNGVPVNGSPSSSKKVSCTWDGRTLTCNRV